jgi:hypothetical protein
VAVSTASIRNSPAFEDFSLLHLDTADRRDGENIGKLDLENVRLAVAHGLRYLQILLKQRPDIVYLPLSQGLFGYLRDAVFLYGARLLKSRVVIHLRGSNYRNFYFNSSPWMKLIIRTSLSPVRRTVVLGDNLRGMLSNLIPDNRVVVIPNATRCLPGDLPGESDRRERHACNDKGCPPGHRSGWADEVSVRRRLAR